MVQIPRLICALFLCIWMITMARAQQISAPLPQPGTIIGTVVDLAGNTIPGASVVLQGSGPDDHREAATRENGFFKFDDVKPAIAYRVRVSAKGFADWTSKPVTLEPGQFFILSGITLRIAAVQVTVNVVPPEQLAIEQLKAEEQQRIFGLIPNFYVVYDRNAVALTPRQKFHLAFRSLIDPATFAGFSLNAGLDHLAEYPSYASGEKGYLQRLGATFADGYTSILVGDAVLPSLLHQDPRYFFQGTGTKRSRLLHALASPLFTRRDNGHRQINYSDIAGDVASGALANAYYPAKDRGPGLVLNRVLSGAVMRAIDAVSQEFILHKITSRHDKEDKSPDNAAAH